MVLQLAVVVKKVFDARKAGWESEKAKWEAKKAELEVIEGLSFPKSAEARAEAEVHKLFDFVTDNKNLTHFELQVDKFLLIENRKQK